MKKAQKPRILFVANTDWYLYNFRMDLALDLVERKWDVIFVSPSGPYVARFQSHGIGWREWQVGRQTIAPWREARSILELRRIYQQEQPDLIHHHTSKAVIYGSLAAMFNKTAQVVNSISGRGYVFSNSDLKAFMLRPIVRVMFRIAFKQNNVQAAIFENPDDHAYFVDANLLSHKQGYLIQSVGVNLAQFPYTPIPNTKPIVVMVSRLLWEKGVGLFVEAARRIWKSTDVRMVLVGMPDKGNPTSIPESTLEGWVQEGVIEWWRWQEDMKSVYQQCTIVVHPTTYGEGIPTVLLEAGASGRPVITTDWPGCREAVLAGKSGLLIPPKDGKALTKAIVDLLGEPARCAEMGLAGRKFAAEHFSTDFINQATISIYQQILAK